MVSPAAATRWASRLSSSAAMRLASNFGCGFGSSFFGCGLASFLGSGFSSFFNTSAMASGFGSSFGSDFGSLFSVALRSGTFSSAGGGVCAEAVTSSGFSTTLAAGLSDVFLSAIFSTGGFGVSLLGALRAPARNCENSVEEMRSTGIDSAGGALSAFGANDTKAHNSTAACALADMVSPVFMAIGAGSGPLFDLRHQRNAVEAGRGEPAHDPHHGAVIHFAIPAHIDALVRSAASLGDRFELCNEIFDLDLGILQKNLALAVDGDHQRLAILVERLGLGLGQIDRHADREQRSRDHEDDQEHQHHVDERRDVDLAHDRAGAMPPLAGRRCLRAAVGAHHARSSIWRDRIAENSSAKPSSRCACLFTSDANLL